MRADILLKTLMELYDRGRLSHAYIIESGDQEASFELVKKLSEHILQSSHLETVPDFEVYDENFNMEFTRQLISKASQIPYKKMRIYVFKKAHELNQNVQNALLKTIEEPPPHALFVFITANRDMLLDTVVSRSETIFPEFLTGHDSGAFDGTIGKIMEFVITGQAQAFADSLRELAQCRQDIDLLLERLLMLMDEALLDKSGVWKARSEAALEIKDAFDIPQTVKLIQITERIRTGLKANVNYQMAVNLLLMNLREVRKCRK